MRPLRWLLIWVPAMAIALPTHADDTLYDLINDRLGLMRDVALQKWHAKRPIEDPEREALVIRSARRSAVMQGIDGDSAARFFSAQIMAAKAIQRYWFRQWAGHPPDATGLDLVTKIRPELLILGDAIVERLDRVPDQPGSQAEFTAALSTTGLTPTEQNALFDALIQVEHYPSTLARIEHSGELRVGTTGDYAPFTHRGTDGQPGGVDIDQAKHLAAELGVRARFVRTSWPTLMDDLRDGHFDIAMGGISRNVARAREARFSVPYFRDGKTTIVRCEDAARFDSLAAIDQPDVRVIVNPGGTNQRFVNTRMRRAATTVWPDNRTIFDEIAAGRADVMFTDGIEVLLQSARIPSLCGSMPTLTYLEKAYMLPRIRGDEAWLETVNVWLGLRVGAGAVDTLISRHTGSDIGAR
jgi:cyclohexadienyl dehydratase